MATPDRPPVEPSDDDRGPLEPDEPSTTTAVKPWDPKKIRITTKNLTLREVVDQINEAEIDLSPDFQRDFVWQARQRTRLVESILLGIPLPAFYFNQERDGTYQVVDGVQRLSTVRLFMADKHTLDDNLEYLHDLKGQVYSELDSATARRFRSTQIVTHIIEPQTPDEIKYDIFGRVNTLGSPLSAQEIRHAMSKARSRSFLKRLTDLDSFDRATQGRFWQRSPDGAGWIRDSDRMANRELALRFCAFRNFSIDDYRQYDSLDSYLVEFTRRLDGRSDKAAVISEKELEQLAADFDRAMENAASILAKGAFRRWPPDSRRGPMNRAIFESQALALADHSLIDLQPKKDAIVDAFRNAFLDPLYFRSVTYGTGDSTSVAHRIQAARSVLAKALA